MTEVEAKYTCGVKTFVAQVVGGPMHGRLYCLPAGVEVMMIQYGLGVEYHYLSKQPDGAKIWLHRDCRIYYPTS